MSPTALSVRLPSRPRGRRSRGRRAPRARRRSTLASLAAALDLRAPARDPLRVATAPRGAGVEHVRRAGRGARLELLLAVLVVGERVGQRGRLAVVAGRGAGSGPPARRRAGWGPRARASAATATIAITARGRRRAGGGGLPHLPVRLEPRAPPRRGPGGGSAPAAARPAPAGRRRTRSAPSAGGRRRGPRPAHSWPPSTTSGRGSKREQLRHRLGRAGQPGGRRGGRGRRRRGRSASAMRARSRAGVEAPRLRTSQPSPSRKSATIWTPTRVALLRAAGDDGQPPVLRRRAHPRAEHAEHRLRHRGRAVLVGDRRSPPTAHARPISYSAGWRMSR